LQGWKHISSGKVRELYLPNAPHPAGDVVLIVSSDRISAFDYVLDTQIPGKGEILTQMSLLWFEYLDLPNHLVTARSENEVEGGVPEAVYGRAMICKRLNMLPVECVVRAYLTGSAFKEYAASGKYQEYVLPPGLADGAKLPAPIFTPAMKAEVGEHDENITFSKMQNVIGDKLAEEVRDVSVNIFEKATLLASAAKMQLVDTKFEFGLDSETGTLTIGDEVLTPDSSRFWDENGESSDKQFVRNWLLNDSTWSPELGEQGVRPPALPEEIVTKTAQLYADVFKKMQNAVKTIQAGQNQ
jgi:phosphoribosylaminoimidazole-succinocarboxamide synthase